MPLGSLWVVGEMKRSVVGGRRVAVGVGRPWLLCRRSRPDDGGREKPCWEVNDLWVTFKEEEVRRRLLKLTARRSSRPNRAAIPLAQAEACESRRFDLCLRHKCSIQFPISIASRDISTHSQPRTQRRTTKILSQKCQTAHAPHRQHAKSQSPRSKRQQASSGRRRSPATKKKPTSKKAEDWSVGTGTGHQGGTAIANGRRREINHREETEIATETATTIEPVTREEKPTPTAHKPPTVQKTPHPNPPLLHLSPSQRKKKKKGSPNLPSPPSQ